MDACGPAVGGEPAVPRSRTKPPNRARAMVAQRRIPFRPHVLMSMIILLLRLVGDRGRIASARSRRVPFIQNAIPAAHRSVTGEAMLPNQQSPRTRGPTG